ncbi:dienelactone hydrolase family protein [Undibacter mobilis]|uniref:Dienelactone hydrolase family protein n=1 Tax=Undibacter mobilis TaxID=2292256 RepID=A0A371B8N1_9BRAD|nr:dienelactone hydrolase family protein [Undibacter mobilis]RDV03914.1 dienelactone hydrolase family protein [Undibacter mobilis]
MGTKLTLTASDNHTLGAYRADPTGTPKGGMVVIQEIFGVNKNIRHVCDTLAEHGYVAIAPAVFDRFQRDFDSGYSADEIAHARSFLGGLNWDHMMADTSAAKDNLKGVGPIGIIGFCLGGSVAFLGACRVPGFAAAVSFYGGAIGKFADEKPKCPMQMHFGEKDESIPMSMIEDIKKKQPHAETYVYADAPHAFSNEDRPSFRPEAADLAWKRTYEFLAKNLK